MAGWLLLGIPYLSCWYICVNQQKYQISGTASLFLLFGIIFPPLGAVFGLWFWVFGPTPWRIRNAITRKASALSTAEITKWLDNAIIEGRLHDDPWVSKQWFFLSQEQKHLWIRARRLEFLNLYIATFTSSRLVPYQTIIAMAEKALGSTAPVTQSEPPAPPVVPSPASELRSPLGQASSSPVRKPIASQPSFSSTSETWKPKKGLQIAVGILGIVAILLIG